ncbi:GNAT family N-acetyltransferase [Marinifilum caeruleilacunae]|uniref:N-acetyltransferase n=1 Tax=Marinifilum caeruleilacunae TaxID=2499076 RepID=A0ABX1WTU1_9BACT|nr:GNAT family N-acetyltransferase [Marinifilum caeruleilacunae]NOU59516.1 N-acetyltransferase [Marinifilum caeruleilacunae]
MILHTERLRLEKLEMKHAESFYQYRSDAETNKYQGWIPYAMEDCKHFIKNRIAKEFNEMGTWFQFAILSQDTNAMIGDLGVHFIDGDMQQVEIGCTLNKQYHCKGYASEATKAVIDYLFTKLKKHRITASVDPDNTASIKLMEKLGFRKEAHFKQSILMNGVWVDDVIYAILGSEWITSQHEN